VEMFVADMLPGRIQAPPAKRPSLPDAFPQGEGKAFNNPPVRVSMNAISHAGPNAFSQEKGWEKEGNIAMYRTQQQGGGGIDIFIRPQPPVEGQEVIRYSIEQQEDVIRSYSGLTLDVVLGIMATLTAPPENYKTTRYPLPERVLVDADSLLKYKGFIRRGQDRAALKRQIEDEIENISKIWLKITGYRNIPPRKANKKTKMEDCNTVRITTPLFAMTKIELGNRTLFSEEFDIVHTAWRVGVGEWGQYWWSEENGTAHWVRTVSKALIELPHSQPAAILAKKIALNAFICGGKSPQLMQSPMQTTVGQLLRNYIGLPEESKRGNDWARRERERLEAAMELLYKIGILERPAEWPDGYGPADVHRGKGWARNWLAARLILHPAEQKREQLTVDGQPQLALPAPPAKVRKPQASQKPLRSTEWYVVDAQMARLVRERLSARRDQGRPIYDMTALAKHLEITQGHLSHVLAGRRRLSKKPHQALLAFLKQPD